MRNVRLAPSYASVSVMRTPVSTRASATPRSSRTSRVRGVMLVARERAGRRGGLVDHPHCDAAAQEVRGQREADGAGPHDEDVGHGSRVIVLRYGVAPLRS